ncbi:unnamed protein product, partial [Adineta steineri]
GLFGQMAATAGGVAVGSAVGHTIGAALTGGYHGHEQPVATQTTTGPTAQPLYQDSTDRYSTDRCNLYQKEFLKCLDNANGDSKQCQGFWEALKECQRYQSSGSYNICRSYKSQQMSASYISSLNFIAQQMTIYLGIPILISGLIGGLINVIVFLSLQTFRQNSCAFYLTVMSIVNIGHLSTG